MRWALRLLLFCALPALPGLAGAYLAGRDGALVGLVLGLLAAFAVIGAATRR